MKKIFCIGIIGISLFASITLLTQPNIKAQANIKGHEITDHKGSKATVYTSSDSAQGDKKIKSSVNVSFIEDPHNSELIALINIKGFIPAKLQKKSSSSDWASMNWTSKYSVGVEIADNNEEVSLLESIPTNKVETVKVKETMGYNIGGNISIIKGTPNISGKGGFSFSKSISYDQPDFKTIQTEDGTRRASWDVEFTYTKDGYDKNSYNILYGNQLFMKSRYYNSGIKNLTDDKDLSSLISGGFSPDIVIAVKAPKNIDSNTTLTLNYSNYMDDYYLEWSSTEWYGQNFAKQIPTTDKHVYTIDWKNHVVKSAKS